MEVCGLIFLFAKNVVDYVSIKKEKDLFMKTGLQNEKRKGMSFKQRRGF